MSKTKSVTVTVIVCALLGIATFAAYRLAMPAFIIIASVFSGIGFLSSASFFCSWLEQESLKEEEAVEPVTVKKKDPKPEADLGPEFTATYDEIKREVEAGL